MTDYNSKYTGEEVEQLLDQVAEGGGVGEQGPQGEVGPQGPQGEQGPKGEDGANGVGIASVEQTTTSTADGGSNVVTVTLTDGTKSTFNVKNGSKGSNGTNGSNGKDGTNGATFTPSVDANGNLSWTNNGGLDNPPTVNIKGPKGDSGEGGGSSSGGGKEIVLVAENVIEELKPNKIYIVNTNGADLEILSIYEPMGSEYAEYHVIMDLADVMGGDTTGSLILPDVLNWANGVAPDLSSAPIYELSIVYWVGQFDYGYNAVLTPFNRNSER